MWWRVGSGDLTDCTEDVRNAKSQLVFQMSVRSVFGHDLRNARTDILGLRLDTRDPIALPSRRLVI